jgi:hypothetical protein
LFVFDLVAAEPLPTVSSSSAVLLKVLEAANSGVKGVLLLLVAWGLLIVGLLMDPARKVVNKRGATNEDEGTTINISINNATGRKSLDIVVESIRVKGEGGWRFSCVVVDFLVICDVSYVQRT